MIKYIIVLVILSSCLFANGKPTTIDQKIMNLSMNFEFDEADRLLSEHIENEESLKNHFLYLSVEIMKIMKVADEVPFSKRRETKEKMNSILIEYAEKVFDKFEDDELSLYDRFYLASIHGILGRLHGVNKSWMSAFSEGKTGRNMMLDIIEEKPDFTDAYLLVGMLNYYADRMGGITEFIASILGLSGDRNIGLEYLRKVEQEGEINNWQATMVLTEIYSRMEGNKFEAIPLLEKMVKRFPENSKFVNWLCYEYMNLHQYKNAGRMITNDTENHINDFVKATYYSGVGDYEKSNEIYFRVLDEEDKTWPWVYHNAKFTRVTNFFYLNDTTNTKKYSKELNEMYTKHFETISKNELAAKEINNFLVAVNIDDLEYVNEFIGISPNYEDSEIVQSKYYYYQAVNKFKNNLFNEAEELFLLSKRKNPEVYGELASQYLIHIYKSDIFDIEKIENLLDDIDSYDNERLEFFSQDLEEKYDL